MSLPLVRRLIPAGLLPLVLAASGCDIRVNEKGGMSLDIAEGQARDEWTRSYTLPAGGRFEIVNVNGSIQASPATGSQVELKALRVVKTQSDEVSHDLLQKIRMVEEVTADRVKVEARADWDRTAGSFGRRSQVNIEYQLGLPPGLNVTLKTENGGVRLERVQGRFAAASTNGGVIGQGLSGSLTALTVNGGVQLEFTSVTGDIEIVTTNGGIRLELPPDVGAMLDARTVNGGIVVDEQLPIETTERARLHVAGRINAGGPNIKLQATNGGVRVFAKGGSGGRGGRRGLRPFPDGPVER